MVLVGVGLAVGLILLSHKSGPGGGKNPCDYCRPRLEAIGKKPPSNVEVGPINGADIDYQRVNYQSL